MSVSQKRNESELDTLSSAGDFHNSKRLKKSFDDYDTVPQKTGILKCIKLFNFMCHDFLQYNVSEHVNFITGRNGSGKSAILSGIIIGFGGKSSDTNRGNSLKSFVKKGRRSATVEITINNFNPNSYKYEEYGCYITIRRKLSIDGTSSYSIKGQHGIVSNKKDELENMLDFFNIQVDNPTTILNQDLARNFLCSSSPTEKYNFFLKSTQLDQIYSLIYYADSQKKHTAEIIKVKEQLIPKMELEVNDWEKRFKKLANIKELNQRLKDLNIELAWVLVRDKENAISKLTEISSLQHKDFAVLHEKLLKFRSFLLNNSNEMKSIEAEINENSSLMNTKKQEIICLTSQLMQNKQFNTSLKNKKNRINEEKCNIDDQIKLFNEKIVDLESKLKEENMETRELRKKRLMEAKDQLLLNQVKLDNVLKDISNLKQTVNSQDQALKEVYKNLTHSKDQEKSYNLTIDSFEKSKKDKILMYGKQMKFIVNEIEKQFNLGVFKSKPLGPIGSLISINDKKFAISIEKALRSSLYSFIVSCSSDADQLLKISNKFKYKLSIITDPFKKQVYDVSKNKADVFNLNGVYCLIDLIESSHPQVINTLIDQHNIERIIIFESSSTAQSSMMKHPPKNVKMAFTLSGDKLVSQPYRFYSNQDKTSKAHILTCNVDKYIEDLKEKLSSLATKIQTFLCSKQHLQSVCDKNNVEIQSLSVKATSIKVTISDINSTIQEAEKDIIVKSTDIDAIKEEIMNQEKLKDSKTNLLNQCELEIEENVKTMSTLQAQIKDLTVQAKKLSETEASIKSNFSKAKMKEEKISSKINIVNRKYSEIKTKCESNVSKIKDLQTIASDYLKKAESFGTRIQTDKSVEDIESEINQTNKVIKAQEKENGDYLQIAQNFKMRRDKLNELKNSLKVFTEFISSLDESISKRFDLHMRIRSSMTTRASVSFQTILKQRGYEGDIKINHNNQTLELDVKIPNLGDFNSSSNSNQLENFSTSKKSKFANSDISSLSGGERSFATICFIVALWRTMNTPLRCLDEFDVFMDMVNRRYSMDLLLHLAKNERSKGVQFIFLTPLNMNYLEASPFLSIFKISKEDSKTIFQESRDISN